MLPLLRKKARLLVLDDDPSMQRLVATLLKRQGHRADVVADGLTAIEKISQTEYDGLLLDLMTPTQGGMTVIRHLREAQPALLKRVVLVTASPDSILKNIAGEVYAVVRKPFDAHELVDTIDRLLAE
ncbi:MAG TPA: response regulator [Thermoanaerobaculia bacterium]|jgi:two-component system sensor histidine kinase/response regulator